MARHSTARRVDLLRQLVALAGHVEASEDGNQMKADGDVNLSEGGLAALDILSPTLYFPTSILGRGKMSLFRDGHEFKLAGTGIKRPEKTG
jgi:hypothetical protein